MSRRRPIAILLLALLPVLGSCASNPPELPCGGEIPQGDPPTPTLGDFPRITKLATGFTIAGSRAPGSKVRIGAGLVVPASCDRFWSATVDLPAEGANGFTVFAETETLNVSPSVNLVITRDTTAPAAPTVDAGGVATTALGTVNVTGTREAGAVVLLNGRPLVPAGAATAFAAQVPLPLGGGLANDLSFTQVDAAGNESAATVVSVTRTSATATPPRLNFPLNRQRLAVPPSFAQMLLIWNQGPPLATYRLQVAPSPAFDPAALALEVDTTALDQAVTLAAGTWFWRVGVVGAGGEVDYGQTRGFTLGPQPGDVDGDGYSDVIAGNPGQDNGGVISSNNGGIKLFPGGADMDTSSPLSATLTASGTELYAEMGIAVTGGDLNGDGFSDMIAGADRADPNGQESGAVHILYGAATPDAGIDLTIEGQNAGDQFGLDLASGFDLNGDGVDDLAVSAWQYDRAGTDEADNAGRVYVFFGAYGGMDGVPDLILTGDAQRINFGSGLGGGFDLNGDGYDDLAVGAPIAEAPGAILGAGRVDVFYGGPAVDGVADLTLYGQSTQEHMGSSIGAAGDLSGAGFDWLATGAPAYGSGGTVAIGRVHLFQGATAPDTGVDLILTGATECEAFGYSLAGGGDFNGDGLADLTVGVPFSNVGAADPTCASQAGDLGMVEVHLGATTPNAAWDARFLGAFANDRLGMGLHTVADANGDGLHDIVAGAPNNDEGSQIFGDSGRAYVLFGPGAAGWSGQQSVTDAGGNMNVPGAVLTNDGDKDGMGTAVW